MYNKVLDEPVVTEATIRGHADEIAVIMITKHLVDMELHSSNTVTARKE